MEEYYTKEQVIELLKEQRMICNEYYEWYRFGISGYLSSSHAIEAARKPNFPAPIKAIPVEKVREVIMELSDNTCALSNEKLENGAKIGVLITLDLIREKLNLSDGKYT